MCRGRRRFVRCAIGPIPVGKVDAICPHCYQDTVTPLPEDAVMQLAAPEMIVPFFRFGRKVRANAEQFAKSIPFRPADLSGDTLHDRHQPVFCPFGSWTAMFGLCRQAETGSITMWSVARRTYQGGRWQTIENRKRAFAGNRVSADYSAITTIFRPQPRRARSSGPPTRSLHTEAAQTYAFHLAPGSPGAFCPIAIRPMRGLMPNRSLSNARPTNAARLPLHNTCDNSNGNQRMLINSGHRCSFPSLPAFTGMMKANR